MKTANEMNAIATRVNEEKAAASRNRAIDVLKNKIVPQIEIASLQGNFSLYYHMDAGVDADVIVTELIGAGYQATCNGCTLNVCWK